MKTNIIIRALFLGAFILLLFTPFAGSPTLLDSMNNSRFFYFAGLSITTFLFAGVGIFIGIDRKKIAINFIDLFVVLFLLYSAVRLFFTEYATFYNFHFLSQFCLTFIYFCVKWFAQTPASLTENRYWQLLIAGFLITGLLQAGVGLMQFYGFEQSYSIFKVTGTFGNPNHYAAYLVSILPLAFGMYSLLDDTQPGLRQLKYLGAITAMAIVLILPGTQTRAAWLAGGMGMGLVLAIKYNVLGRIRATFNHFWKVTAAFASIILVLCTIASVLFQLKPDSAVGRLLIWKITANMIAEKPLFGIGHDRYAVDYNHYQAAYFNGGLRSETEQRLAQHTKHVHNDYLQIFAEGGFIGILLFCGMIFSALFAGAPQKWTPISQKSGVTELRIAMQASLLAILVNALFFFPMKVLETSLHLYFLLGLISATFSCKSVIHFELKQVLLKAYGVFILCFAIYFGYQIHQQKTAYANWQTAGQLAALGDSVRALSKAEEAFPVLKNNGEFLFFYGGLLYKSSRFKDALSILNESRKRFTDPNLEILLAETFRELGEFDKVVGHLQISINMVPHKFHARYLLAKHYADRGDTASAVNLAKEILDLPVKVSSTAVYEIKDKAQQLVDSQKIKIERTLPDGLQPHTVIPAQ